MPSKAGSGCGGPRGIARFDTAAGMARALGRFLHSEEFDSLTGSPAMDPAAAADEQAAASATRMVLQLCWHGGGGHAAGDRAWMSGPSRLGWRASIPIGPIRPPSSAPRTARWCIWPPRSARLGCRRPFSVRCGIGADPDDARRGIARASLLGDSFPCQIIVALAARHPDRVDRCILQGPTAPPDSGAGSGSSSAGARTTATTPRAWADELCRLPQGRICPHAADLPVVAARPPGGPPRRGLGADARRARPARPDLRRGLGRARHARAGEGQPGGDPGGRACTRVHRARAARGGDARVPDGAMARRVSLRSI